MKTNRSVRAFLALSSALLLTVSVACNRTPVAEAPARPAAKSDIPKIDFEKYTLPNGLDVILSEDHRLPLVAVNLWYHVGPANEEPGPHRLRASVRAHDVPGLEARAARHALQDSSRAPAAATSTARPTSIARTTSRRCRRTSSSSALWLESDRMGYLLDVVDQAKLRQPAGRGPQRAAAERREPAVRHRRRSDVPHAVPEEPSVLRRRHRLARRHPGREARRREELLQDVLRAQQRQPGDRRRHRQGGDEGAGREVFRPVQAGRRRCRNRQSRRRRSRPNGARS